MMLSVLFLAVGLLFGEGILGAAKVRFKGGMRLAASLVIGVYFLSLLLLGSTYLLAFRKESIVLVTSLTGLLALRRLQIWLADKERLQLSLPKLKPWWLAGLFLAQLVVWGGIWGNTWRQEPDGIYSTCRNCFGDWAAHLSYTTSFAFGDNFPPHLPILAQTRFSYPFLIDFLTAILIKLGLPLGMAFQLLGLLLSQVLVIVLFHFGRTLTKKISGGVITVGVFLLNGGLGIAWFFQDVAANGTTTLWRQLPRAYTDLSELGYRWINGVTSQLLPQRGLLLALPLSLLIYFLFWQTWPKAEKRPLLLAGIIAGCLPLVHAHSFLAVMFVAGILGASELIVHRFDRQFLIKWLSFFVPAIGLSVLPAIWFYGHIRPSRFFSWHPGWLADQENWLWFWAKNIGLALPLSLIGWLKAPKPLRAFVLPFLGIFIIGNLWLFQPWDWDNTKLFLHWYVIVAVLTAVALVAGWEGRSTFRRLILGVVLGATVGAGLLDTLALWQYPTQRYRLWSRQQLELAAWVRDNTEPQSLWVTASNHDHWLPALTGRSILIGYEGWLWTYQADYGRQRQAREAIFKGGSQAEEWLETYGIDYVMSGPTERQLGLNQDFFLKRYPLVYQDADYRIFAVK